MRDLGAREIELFNRIVPERIKPYIKTRAMHAYVSAQKLFLHGLRDLPSAVNIETNSLCTRSCYYCPRDGNSSARLDDDQYYSIIDQLAEWGFKGRVSPQGHNEPLTDPRIFEFLKYTREKLPGSEIVFFTNSDLLDRNKIDMLAESGVNKIKASIHEPSSDEFAQTMMGYHEHYRDFFTVIDMRDATRETRLSNRGGLIELDNIVMRPRCYKIDVLAVKANGNVILCCSDYTENRVFGNINDTSIKDIWEDPEFRAIRDNIRKGKYSLDICKSCGYEDV